MGHCGDVITKFGDDRFVCYSSQTIEPKELKFKCLMGFTLGCLLRN